MHFGIDYGSKLAGTTAICYNQSEVLHLLQSEKKKDADKFILEEINRFNPEFAFLDAPLSLPSAYFKENPDQSNLDYHYRKCDRALKAMSPMFLGGLTARAMALKSNIRIPVYETYPGHFARAILSMEKKLKKIESKHIKMLESILPYPLANKPENVHQFDSILAWQSGWRWTQGEAQVHGAKEEGLIFI